MTQHLLKNSFLRGVLFLLLCVVGIGNAWGEEVTLSYSNVEGLGKSGGGAGFEYTIAPITFSFSNAYGHPSDKHIKVYGSSSITFSGATITKIVITATSDSYIGTWSDGTDKITVSKEKATWKGSANSVTLKNTASSQARIKTITVTYVVDTSITYSIIDRHNSGTNREYYVGDTPTADGLALIDNSGQEITEGVTWSFDPQTIQEDTKSVTASAEYQGVKRAEYTYNITNKGTRTLSSIEIEGEPEKTSYYIGDTPSAQGLTVYAVYSNGSRVDVTNDVTWTFNPETITEGTTEVIATAIYKELTATYNFRITIQDFPPIYELIPIKGGTTAYDGAGTTGITINGVTWYVTGNSQMRPWRIGGESLNKVDRDIKCSTPINGTFGKVVVSIGTTSGSITLHSLTLSVADNPDFTNATKYKHTSNLNANTKHTFDITPATNAYYKITFNVTVTGTSNKYYQFSGAKFYRTDNVEISSAGLATFCLPYNATIPNGLTAYTATDNGTSVTLTAKEDNTIAAGEGVVLKGNEGTYTFVATAEDVSFTANNQMVGVTEKTELTSDDNAYMLTRKIDDGSIAFRLLKTNYTLGANKAYLKASNTANTRELIPALWDDNATGIDNIAKDEATATGAIYNLAGQKLMRAQKGINIINGKLVIK